MSGFNALFVFTLYLICINGMFSYVCKHYVQNSFINVRLTLLSQIVSVNNILNYINWNM